VRRVAAPGSGYAAGLEAAHTLFALRAERPDGVFCANDAIACGLVDGVQRFGLRVPHDLLVIGFDDIPMSAQAAYGLTTLRQDVDGLARETVACLAERIGSPGMATRVRELPVSLVERASTATGGGVEHAPAAPRPARTAPAG
jgi:DNA-binding LacI/PurR family transcriptional regulator